MPFGYPAIFWTGLSAVSLPILIHLLNRSSFRVRLWAAMQFLLESLRKNRRRLQLEQLILLLLRCLIVLLLALALAKLSCHRPDALPGGQQASRAIVFLLDDSYSMDQRHGAGTLFSAAIVDLTEQIKALNEADKPTVLLASRIGQADAVLSGEGLIERIERLKVSDRRVNLADALVSANDILRGAAGEKFLFVLSDFRRVDLSATQVSEAVRQQFKQLDKLKVKVVAMDYGQDASHNLTVESIQLLGKGAEARVAIAGQPTRIALTVRNNGPSSAKNVEVHLRGKITFGGQISDMSWPSAVIDSVDAGGSRRIEHKITCPEPGAAVITAKLPTDELLPDNAAHLALDVRKAVRALIVDGDMDAARPTRSESYFIARALDPNADGAYGNRVKVIRPEGLGEVDFDDYDFVVMTDVPEFASSLKALQDYVRGGGGLAIFTGRHVSDSTAGRGERDFYNGPLYDGGAGLSPFRIQSRKGTESRRGPFFRIAPKSVRSESILRVFSKGGLALTGLIRFFAFTPADTHLQPVRSNPDAGVPIVLAAFDDPNRSPAVVARSYGKGTVVMFYTTASSRWHDWPTDPVGTYVIVLNDIRNYLAATGTAALAARVDEPIVFELMQRLPAEPSDLQRRRMTVASASVERPDGAGTVVLQPKYRFESVASKIRRVTELLGKVNLSSGGSQALAAARTTLDSADKQFARRDLGGVTESLKAIEAHLAEACKAAGDQSASPALAAAENARATIRQVLKSDPAALTRRELRYGRPDRAGMYSLKLLDGTGAPVGEVLYARNVDPAEGNLAASDREELASAFGTDKFRYEKRLAKDAPRSVRTAEEEHWALWLLGGMLAAMALETFLSQRFGHYTVTETSKQ